MQQIKQGLLEYIEVEVISKIDGLAKWGTAFLSVSLVDSYLEKARPFLENEDHQIDLECIYSKLLEVAKEKGSVTQHFPFIGNITFTSLDVTKLYEFIKKGNIYG